MAEAVTTLPIVAAKRNNAPPAFAPVRRWSRAKPMNSTRLIKVFEAQLAAQQCAAAMRQRGTYQGGLRYSRQALSKADNSTANAAVPGGRHS